MRRDCTDGAMRDLLPDYVHGTSPAAERARVAAHVASCADCAAEVELLRSVVAAYPAPELDEARVVAAITGEGDVASRPLRVARGGYELRARPWLIAAGATLVVLGGLSLAVLRGGFDRGSQGGAGSAPQVATPLAPESSAAAPRAQAPLVRRQAGAPAATAQVALSFGGGLSDLTDAQLETLLRELEALDTAPSVEPEHTTPIIPTTSGATRGR